MQRTKEELMARKKEILDFLSKHFAKDPKRMENFTTKYPDYSNLEGSTDPSVETLEIEDYDTNLAIEQAMEDELLDVEDQLAKLA
jgi:hypothetical protein